MKWYQEKTFKIAMWCQAVLGIVFTIGASLVSHKFTPDGLFLFGAGILMTVVLTYTFRNNP